MDGLAERQEGPVIERARERGDCETFSSAYAKTPNKDVNVDPMHTNVVANQIISTQWTRVKTPSSWPLANIK